MNLGSTYIGIGFFEMLNLPYAIIHSQVTESSLEIPRFAKRHKIPPLGVPQDSELFSLW